MSKQEQKRWKAHHPNIITKTTSSNNELLGCTISPADATTKF